MCASPFFIKKTKVLKNILAIHISSIKPIISVLLSLSLFRAGCLQQDIVTVVGLIIFMYRMQLVESISVITFTRTDTVVGYFPYIFPSIKSTHK